MRPRLRDGLMPWIYYWLDMYGPDGSPAHGKVMSTIGFLVALGGEIWWGIQLTLPRCIEAAGGFQCIDPAGITWPFVFLVALTLAMSFGADTFKAALKLRVTTQGTGGAE